MSYSILSKIDFPISKDDSIHLVEHALINEFYRILHKDKIPIYLVGWIEGYTREASIVLNARFYDKSVHILFNQYIALPSVTEASVELALRSIGAEKLVDVSKVQVSTATKKCNDLLQERAPSKGSNYSIKYSEKESLYRDITIGCYLTNADVSIDEMKLFLPFSALIGNFMHHYLREQFGAYLRGDTVTQKDETFVGFISVYTLACNTGSNEEINSKLLRALHKIDSENIHPYVQKYFSDDYFLWQKLPVDYFMNTGIWTTAQELQSLATEQNIKSLLTKINILVRDSTELDFEEI